MCPWNISSVMIRKFDSSPFVIILYPWVCYLLNRYVTSEGGGGGFSQEGIGIGSSNGIEFSMICQFIFDYIFLFFACQCYLSVETQFYTRYWYIYNDKSLNTIVIIVDRQNTCCPSVVRRRVRFRLPHCLSGRAQQDSRNCNCYFN